LKQRARTEIVILVNRLANGKRLDREARGRGGACPAFPEAGPLAESGAEVRMLCAGRRSGRSGYCNGNHRAGKISAASRS